MKSLSYAHRIKLCLFCAICMIATPEIVFSQSSCSASNEIGQTCSVVCDVGQSAICIPANGASFPECFCTGVSTGFLSQSNSQLSVPFSTNVSPDIVISTTASDPITLVDANSVATSLLASYGPVPTNREVVRTVNYEKCHNSGPQEFRGCDVYTSSYREIITVDEILTHGPLEIVTISDFNFEKPTLMDLPTDVTIALARAQNCQSSGIASFTEGVSVSVSRSASLSVTSSVTQTIGKALGFSFKIPNSPVTLNGNLSISNSSTSGTVVVDQESGSINRAATATVGDIKPNTAVAIEISAYKIGIIAPFTVSLVIDAELSVNNKGLKRLSEIAAVEQRTFFVRGVLNTNSASQANVIYYDAPFLRADCKGVQTFSFESPYVPENELQLMVREAQ